MKMKVRQSKCNIFPCNGRCCWRGQGRVILFMIVVIMALLLLAMAMAGLLAKTMGTKLIIFYCSCVWYNGNGGDIGTNDGKMIMMVVSWCGWRWCYNGDVMMMMMMMMAMKAMLLNGDIVDGINGSLRKEMTLQCHYWFLHEMTSKKWAQKFHTDDLSLPTSG